MSSLARRLERNQERKAAKKAERAMKKAPSTVALGGLMQIQQQLTEMSRVVPMMLPHLNQLRAVTAHLIEEQESIKYELARNRAVNMRFALAHFYPAALITDEAIPADYQQGVAYIGQRYTDLEQQFRAEYDALAVLANLGAWSLRQAQADAEAAAAPKELIDVSAVPTDQADVPGVTVMDETPQLEATG